MIDDLIGDVLGGLLPGWSRRGGPVRLDAGLRLPDRRLVTWWRHGYVELGPDCSWVPRRPRAGRRVALPGLRVGPSRRLTVIERVLLNSDCRVFEATAGDSVRLEIAVLPDDVARLPRVRRPA
ncbi:hypothetical protein KOI35_33950 [Actinoplanes bogorensis]|uniref:Uncharacterized protein n=1 Tax=Paractinoplanes bogorensis TaxID=1610840 RepID=A0ABS5YYR3_9ACTN|nr:hypothetical protein [Actinoplanes bogorensis]MBU2668528.1 hypothetical protein [Actinoplanes bogorensis]